MSALNAEFDGIAIVTDGGENTPPYFAQTYQKYCAKIGKDVPVYMYQCLGDEPRLIYSMSQAGIPMDVFDLRGKETDYVSLPNLVKTMRTSRYSLQDEILETPLLKLPDAYKHLAKAVAAKI